MANNFYGVVDGSTNTAGQQTVVHYYDRAGIKAANRVNVYAQWADRRSMPTKYGKTFKISRFEHLYDRKFGDADFAEKGYLTARSIDDMNTALTSAGLTEGAGATNQRTLTKVTVETSFARYGEMLDYTDEVEIFSEDYVQVKYREELGELANSRMEDLIQRDMLATTTVVYPGGAGAMVNIGDGVLADGTNEDSYTVSYDLIRRAVRKLTRNRAKKNTSIVTGSTKIGTTPIAKSYYAIIGADIKSDLETLTRGSTYETEFVYTPAHKYAGAASLAEGEVGAMHEVRFIEAESAAVYRQSGAELPVDYVGNLQYTGTAPTTAVPTPADPAQFDVFPILFPTEGAFATVGLKGHEKIKFNAKAPSQVENANPYGTLGFFSYNFFYAGLILREEALVKVLVAANN